MSSGIGGGISGGVAGRGGGRGGGGTYRKNSKKFGKNLNKLTKAPAAPPVPVTSAGGGGGSSSFRGSSSSRNGLLLLSTKSKSSGGGGLLASSGTPKTAFDALLFSAGAGGQGGGEAGKKPAPAPAWGMGEKKQAAPSPEKKAVEKTGEEGNEKPELVLSRRNSLQQQKPLSSLSVNSLQQQKPLRSLSSVSEVAEKVEKLDLKTADSPKKIAPPDSSANDVEKPIDKPISNSTQPKATQAKEMPAIVAKQAPQKEEKVKDNQVEYMSKLAKERAEKLRLEEETRMAAQKERAAIRLRELEEKRLEEKKKQQQVISQARKELSKPQVILEPLGKPKKDATNSSSPKPTSKNPTAEKNGGRKLYDPDRPYSSLVGGKTVKAIVDNAKKQEERPRGNTKKPPVMGPAAPHGRQSVGHSSTDNKKDDPPPPVHMVQLSNLDELDRGGRGGGQGGPRMLFDPTSGSMVAVPSREEPKTMKKTKQNKGPQKFPAKRSDEVSKIISRRPIDGGVTNESGLDVKLLRGKQGKVSRKDEPMLLQQKNKKLLDNKCRPIQHQTPRKRIPRTCGVRYKIDKSGNYLIADGCEPDNGYGAHRVPGGKVKNPGAHAKLLNQQEEKNTVIEPSTNATPATEGFSFRNDPGFLQHQTDFEAQQQKILEDAWASLVETEEQPKEEESEEEDEEEEGEVPASKSADDEYAAALAISSSMIGLDFDPNDNIDSVLLPAAIKASANPTTEEPIDLAKFALQAASSASAVKPANPFTPFGVSGAGLWGAGTPGAASTAYGDLGALTGWDATPFAETDTAGAARSAGLNGSSSHASKLRLWGGSSALDDGGLGAFGNSNVSKGAD